MFYQINVSLNGKHFFETDKYSIPNKETMEEVYKIFKKKFPIDEGYELLVWDMVGRFIDTNYLNEDN